MIKKIGIKFIIIFTIAFIIPVSIITIYTINKINKLYEHEMINIITTEVDEAESNINEIYIQIDNISRFIVFSDVFQDYIIGNYNKESQLNMIYLMGEYLGYDITKNNFIESIIIMKDDKVLLSKGDVYTPIKSELTKIQSNDYKIHWSNGYAARSIWEGDNIIINVERAIPNRKNIYQNIGKTIVQIKEDTLYSLLEKNIYPKFSDVFIVNEQGMYLINKDQNMLGSYVDNRKLLNNLVNDGTFFLSMDNKEYIVLTRKIKFDNALLVAMVEKDLLLKEMKPLKLIFGINTIVFVILGLVLFALFYFTVIKRIVHLSHKVNQVTDGNMEINIDSSSDDEIGDLERNFRNMILRINKHINIEYNLKLKQKESELRTLQNQIKPHFLYNTLDMIRWNARIEKAFETSELIEMLARIFRINLSSGSMWMTIDLEKKYIESYLKLQKKRLGNNLHYELEFDNGIGEYYIIKQLIQPLIENSFKHGFKNETNKMIIKVVLKYYEKFMLIYVKDNGKGIDKDLVEQDKYLTKGYALKNLQERIQLLFGSEYGIKYDKKDDKYTTFIMKLPIIREKPDDTSNTIKL